MKNNRTHDKNEKRSYKDYKGVDKDDLTKVCTVLYKMNDYFARVSIRNNYKPYIQKGIYRYKINASQFNIKLFFIPIFKHLKNNYEMEFIKNVEYKIMPDGDYLIFHLDTVFVSKVCKKGFDLAYRELICSYNGEFDGNICKGFSKKIRKIS